MQTESMEQIQKKSKIVKQSLSVLSPSFSVCGVSLEYAKKPRASTRFCLAAAVSGATGCACRCRLRIFSCTARLKITSYACDVLKLHPVVVWLRQICLQLDSTMINFIIVESNCRRICRSQSHQTEIQLGLRYGHRRCATAVKCCRRTQASDLWRSSAFAHVRLRSTAVTCLLTGSIARSAKCRLFNLLRGRFWGFSPRRGHTLHRWGWNLARRRGP